MSNVTGFLFTQRRMAGHLATWSNNWFRDPHITCMEQKAFHENKPLSCSSTLCIWSLLGRCHSKDGHLVMSTRGTPTSFTLRRPAHNIYMFQDLHTLYCIPWTSPHTSYRFLHHTHTHTNTPHTLSPQPPSLSIAISACGPHTPHDVGM